MKSITIKKLFKLHSWMGIITGILLFIIAFSGAVAVFARPELTIWANPEIRAQKSPDFKEYQQLIQQYADQMGKAYQEEVHYQWPGNRTVAEFRIIYEGHFEQPDGKEKHQGTVFEFEPENLTLLRTTDMDEYFANPRLDMASFLAHFHADLHLGRPIGLILTGLLGLTLMVSIVTGVFIHRKILAQLFTFRPKKSLSLMLNDGHKAMSVWGLIFHTVIGFTGAFLGLATVILIPAAAYVSFQGDQEQLVETFTAVKAPEMAYIEKPTQLATIMEKSIELEPAMEFNRVTVMGYGDANALVYVFGAGSDHVGGQQLIFKGATGEYLRKEANFGRLPGVTGKILDVMFPLHFGNFGGIMVKALWAILGLATALLPISGIMLWIERGLNSPNPAHSRSTYNNLSKLLIGSCGGIVLATALLFPGQLILNHLYPLANQNSALFMLFFISWAIALTIPFVVDQNKAFKLLATFTASCLIVTLPMDAVLNQSHILNVFDNGHYVSSIVNICLLIMGVLLLRALYKKREINPQPETEQAESL